jgi:hypothetical protein
MPKAQGNDPVKKEIFVQFFLAARPRLSWSLISIILYRQQFVKRKVVQKLKSLDARICALCHVDFWGGAWYTIGVKGRDPPKSWEPLEGRTVRSSCVDPTFRLTNFLEKISRNPLTNSPSCDTMRMSKGKSEYQIWEKFLWQSRGSEVPPYRLGKAKKKNVKNLLTNSTKCGIIKIQMREARRPRKGGCPRERVRPR